MTTHHCPHCGYQDQCSYGSWFDRHPKLGVIGSMFALVFMGMLFSVYTLGAAIMTAIVVSGISIRASLRAHRARVSLVRRADWEHAAMMARPVPPPVRPLPPVHAVDPPDPIHPGRRAPSAPGSAPVTRPVKVIDTDLTFLTEVRSAARERGGRPSMEHIDELLDERLAHTRSGIYDQLFVSS